MLATKPLIIEQLKSILKDIEDEAIIVQDISIWQGTEETTKKGDEWRTYRPDGTYRISIAFVKPQINEERCSNV